MGTSNEKIMSHQDLTINIHSDVLNNKYTLITMYVNKKIYFIRNHKWFLEHNNSNISLY